MEETDLEQLKYPVGKFRFTDLLDATESRQWIADISTFPRLLKAEVEHLTEEELEWRYRPGGWSIRQVVHHCADSHINSQMRFKLALTEENPTIKPYFEDRWAELADAKAPVAPSLLLLEGLHHRWTVLLESLSDADLGRTYFHPEHNKSFNLGQTIGLYSWHCRHHLQHVRQAKEAKGLYQV